MVIGLGLLLVVGGLVLLFDLAGAARWLTRNLTAKDLGRLAPGYAATRDGLRVYAVLLIAIGAAALGVVEIGTQPLLGLAVAGAGGLTFVVASLAVIAGEVRTYRALPAARRPGGRPEP